MADLRATLVQTGTQFLVKTISEQIRAGSPPPPQPALPPPAPPPVTEERCPACEAHDETAAALGLAQLMERKTPVTGEVTDSTVILASVAREHIRKAQDRLRVVAQSRPSLEAPCATAISRLEAARAGLPAEPGAAADGIPTVTAAIQEASVQAQEIAYEFNFPAASPDQLEVWYETARRDNLTTAQAMARLKEMLGD